MTNQGSGAIDLAEVAKDGVLIDLLAGRAAVPGNDPVAGLLAALAAEVDDGLAELLAADDAAAGPSVPVQRTPVPITVLPAQPVMPARRGHGLRVAAVAVVVGATLSVSGVAAAVTGDPFAPYRGIVSAVTGGDDESGAHAAKMAWLQRQLATTRAKVAHGDLAGATADIAAMQAQLAATEGLTRGQRTALEAKIAALQASLVRATAAAEAEAAREQAKEEKVNGGQGQGQTAVPAPQSTKSPEPQSTRSPEPQSTRSPEPQNTRSPEPQNTGQVEPPAATQAPVPQDAKPAKPISPTPRSTNAATPDDLPGQPQDTRADQSQDTKIAAQSPS